MYRVITATLFAAVACLFICPDCVAQSLPAEKQAEVAFQIDMERLRGTPMYDMMSANIEQMQAQTGMSNEEFDWKDVNKMFGAMSLPEDVAAFEEMQGGERSTRFFERFDANGDGSIDQAEFEAARAEFRDRKGPRNN